MGDEEEATKKEEMETATKEEPAVSDDIRTDVDDDADAPTQMVSVRQLFTFARTRKTRCFIAGAFFCACISGAVFPAVAFYFAKAFQDLATPTEDGNFMSTIRELAYTFMVLGAIVFCSMTAQATLMETAAAEMTMNLKTEWFKALLRQDITYYDIMDVSGEATIITTNANKYRKGIGRKLAEGVQFFITFFGGLGYAFWASWQTSLAVLAIAPFITVSTIFLVKMNKSVTSRANASYAKAGSIVSTSVSAIRTILALNAVEIMIERFKAATREAYEGAVSQVAWLGLANGCSMGSMLLSYIIVTLFGSWLLYDQVKQDGCDPSAAVSNNESCNPSATDIFGALFGITFAAAVLPQISVAVEALVGARVACYPAFVVIHRTVGSNEGEEDTDKDGDEEQAFRRGGSKLPDYKIDSSSDSGLKPEKVKGNIEFRNVCFHYPTRKENEVLKDFSLKIGAGKTVALVGSSGSGKSSIVQLIERFYDPTSGSITLDGTDLRDLNVKWLRQHIGFISQEPKLFECSIRENIAFGCPGASEEQIEEAARMANAHDFIVSLPKSYDTDVGSLGSQLSGGQRQRIAIARCLVKKPRVMLMDEATSALDTESERLVQDALDELMELGNMTIVVIAHRLSTIKNADLICVVDEGKIVETGTHQDLLANGSHYHRLVEAQKGKSNGTPVETPSSSIHESETASSVALSAYSDSEGAVMIEFDNVCFEYPSRPDISVFDGFKLKVMQGETLALVGSSGSGKSSIVQLIERFYDPTSGGVIKYKGVDMKDLNVRWLRDQLGLVSQEPVLFDVSIEDNIRYSMPEATHEQVVEAAKQANAHNFIMEFPEGYATSVGADSSLVSGGQKQRICIARALIKKPKVLLLDEATSALDSSSEKIVQEALDKIMSDKEQTCVVIAHRLSTIQGADRIAVVEHGKIVEIGSHSELMAKPNGRYSRLQDLQSLDAGPSSDSVKRPKKKKKGSDSEKASEKKKTADSEEEEEEPEIDKKDAAVNAKRARLLASGDTYYFFIGGIGALLAGLVFPAWGFIFAYMIEILYTPVVECEECQDYWNMVADDMQQKSFSITYGFLAIIASTLVGFALMFWGFGKASERMNKRVRDAAFTSLLRQEVSWFDLRSPGTLTSRLSDDAALLHAFSGEPIRSLVLSLSSVLVGLVVSFIFMWPFALLTLAIMPFMAFGAEMEMRMYYGEDDGDETELDANSPGGIVIESLSNIRTVASLTLEDERATEYSHALEHEDPHPVRTNFFKGAAAGSGQFVQMWGSALMFWWGGWLLFNFDDVFEYRDYLVSMFSLLFSLYGLTVAAQGAVDRDKAKRAAARIFELTDRQSLIDPLSTHGEYEV